MHFLQSEPWENFQKSLGRQTFRLQGDGWQFMAILEKGTGNTRLYCPYGPSARDESSFNNALTELLLLGKKQGVTFVRIEPTNETFTDYLKQNKWLKTDYQQLNPEMTSVLDLSPPVDEIVANMSQPHRNIYRNYYKKGVSIEASSNPSDLPVFLDLVHQVAKKAGISPHKDSYFQAQADILMPIEAAKLFIATHQDSQTSKSTPVAAALFYDSPETRYYAHAGSTSQKQFRNLNAGAALVAEAIVDAKKQGLQFFDFYGVIPKDSPASHPWYGFSSFKRAFGGKDKKFAGTWELPLNKLGYMVYRGYQSLR